jgi:integrase/recombinase XerD
MPKPIRSRQDAALITIHDLCDDFIARCHAKNLTPRTIEWYEMRIRCFSRWCEDNGMRMARSLSTEALEQYLIDEQSRGISPNTVHSMAQMVKTLCRFGYRKGYMPDIITGQFEMPKVPQVLIETFTDDQLRALLNAPSPRRWSGVRDRAILLMLLDTMARLSEIADLSERDVELDDRIIRVMGKGRKERELPIGKAAALAAGRYRRSVADLQPDDPFFISQYGKKLDRRSIYDLVRQYGQRAGIKGVRCSPHTLRHTGAKRFILNGGDVFTLQRMLGHTTMYMVRRYVQLSNLDVRQQHARFSPADSLLRKPTPTRGQSAKRNRTPDLSGIDALDDGL